MASNWVSSLWNATTYSYNILRHKLVPGQDEFYLVVGPVVIYWVISLVYELLDRSNHPYVLKHRVARKDPGRGNPVGRGAVFRRVLLQQFIQTVLGCVVMVLDPEQCTNTPQPANLLHAAVQLVIGMVVMDAWQYWIHRGMHVNKFLYRHIHSTHHRLVLPYAFGALYNHPLEALLLDTLGAGISMYAAGMSCKLATAFFMFSTAKTVLDHCNYRFPLNPLHDIFPNSAAYHDVHHDVRGIKNNFSQPYFTFWDHVCGTYLDPARFHLTPAELAARVDASTEKPNSAAKQQEQQPAETEEVINQAGVVSNGDTSSNDDETGFEAVAAAMYAANAKYKTTAPKAPKAARTEAAEAEAEEPVKVPAADEDVAAVITATPARTPARRSRVDKQSIGVATPVTGGPTTRSRARAAAAVPQE